MDILAYCKAYHAATGVHISLLRGGAAVYSSLAEALSLPLGIKWELFPIEQTPRFCSLLPDVLYGMARVLSGEPPEHIILGPAYNIPVAEDALYPLMSSLGIPPERKDALLEALNAAPVMNGLSLAKHLSLISLCVNGRAVSIDEVFAASGVPAPEIADMQARFDDLESGRLHNSYYFEVEMYQKVREGSEEMLNRFFRDNAHVSLCEGSMAATPLRHAKNVFISVVSRTGFIGAIPGNLDVEKTYQLMDYYIRECERLNSVEAVNDLQYAMVKDFCRRTGEAKRPENVSTDVWHCMNYIRAQIYAPITLSDVARSVHRSPSYVMKKFKSDLGVRVSEYITRCKLEEARTMLVFTEKSLSQISSDLYFSSQSYFQNLFKKAYGITPARFRKRERMLAP